MIYQMPEGGRKEIEGGYRMVDAHTVAFAIGKYDHSQTLVIDPFLSLFDLFRRQAGDTAYAVALDSMLGLYCGPDVFQTD